MAGQKYYFQSWATNNDSSFDVFNSNLVRVEGSDDEGEPDNNSELSYLNHYSSFVKYTPDVTGAYTVIVSDLDVDGDGGIVTNYFRVGTTKLAGPTV